MPLLVLDRRLTMAVQNGMTSSRSLLKKTLGKDLLDFVRGDVRFLYKININLKTNLVTRIGGMLIVYKIHVVGNESL